MNPNIGPPPCVGVNDAALGTALLLDVRRAAAFAAADTMLPGASWHDPADIATWISTLPRDREIVVYCVHGHEVSQGAARRLCVEGFRARYLGGGIEAWVAQGRPLQAKRGPK